LNGDGVPVRAKVVTITLLWLSIGISLWVVEPLWLHVLLFSIALGVTLYMLSLPVLLTSVDENSAAGGGGNSDK
jgi:hypothetical protein